MIRKTKIGDVVIVKQTTYYVYNSEADQKEDKFLLCTSDIKKINDVKRQLRNYLKKNSKTKY